MKSELLKMRSEKQQNWLISRESQRLFISKSKSENGGTSFSKTLQRARERRSRIGAVEDWNPLLVSFFLCFTESQKVPQKVPKDLYQVPWSIGSGVALDRSAN